MKLLFLSDAYMHDGSFDPFRLEVLKTLSLYSSSTLAITTNHYLYNNSCHARFLCGFSSVLKKISGFKPDIVFTINRAGMTQKLIDVLPSNCIVITWFIDSYERVSDSLLKFKNNDVVWLTGKEIYEQNFRDTCGKYCASIVTVPFASNTKIFTSRNKERVIDGCFVGTAFSNSLFTDLLNSICDNDEQREIFLKVLNSHKKSYISDIKSFLENSGFKEKPERNREVWQTIFDDQVSLEKRIIYLSTLDNFNLVIYGEPNNLWIESFAAFNSNMLSKYQYKPIKTPDDLSELYNIAKIGINLQHHQACTHSLPIRVFDLMACKTLLLTEKSSTNALNQLGFLEDVDFVTFGNPKELKEKFSYYISSNMERDKIVDSAYSKVVKSHDLRHRITSSLEQSLPSSIILINNDFIDIKQLCNPPALKISNYILGILNLLNVIMKKIKKLIFM